MLHQHNLPSTSNGELNNNNNKEPASNDAVDSEIAENLESLLTDLQRTTEILRRAGRKSADETQTSGKYSSSYDRKSGSYADGTDPLYQKSAQDYGSRSGSAGGARNSGRIDSMLSSQSEADKSDYHTIPKGTCGYCGQDIVGEVIIALGLMWHPEHFTCCHCGDEIGHKNFFERSGKAYCENDYHDLYSPRCAYCNGPIKERCITALGKQFHVDHFLCGECGRPLNGEEGFHEKNGQQLCREDFFRLYAPKCEGCNKAITSKFITALSTHWHPECFRCDADDHFAKQCPMNVTYFEEEEYY